MCGALSGFIGSLADLEVSRGEASEIEAILLEARGADLVRGDLQALGELVGLDLGVDDVAIDDEAAGAVVHRGGGDREVRRVDAAVLGVDEVDGLGAGGHGLEPSDTLVERVDLLVDADDAVLDAIELGRGAPGGVDAERHHADELSDGDETETTITNDVGKDHGNLPMSEGLPGMSVWPKCLASHSRTKQYITNQAFCQA